MTASPFGFPQAGAPMQMPGAPMAAPQVGFVLDIPTDPTWEPFKSTDVLEKDGYYCVRITEEKPRNDPGKSSGIFLTVEVQDQDAQGKLLSRFLPDPRTSKGNVWFLWRGLMHSITGSIDGGRTGFQYTPGKFTNQLAYVKTERNMREQREYTDIDSWITGPEWQEAVRTGRHRWPAKVTVAGSTGAVGALPGGLPGGFPGGLPGSAGPAMPMGGGGLPGMPAPAAPIAPQPMAGPPMQQAPVAQPQAIPTGFAAPPAATAPAPALAFAAAPAFAPPPAAAAPQTPFGFGPPAAAAPAPTGGAPAPAPFAFTNFPGQPPAPGINGAPAPTAAGMTAGFPLPGQPAQ
jgi:hypothetical protein